MKLRDVIERLDEFDDGMTIYAESPPTAESRAVVAPDPDEPPGGEATFPAEAAGLDYLLEVSEAKDVLEVLREWLGKEPTPELEVEAVVHYAKYDAYLEV